MSTHLAPPLRSLSLAGIGLAALAASVTSLAQEAAPLVWGVQIERLEYRAGDTDVLAWEGDGIAGTDELKLRLQSEGEYDRDADAFETLEHQLALQWPIADFFDLKAGLRFDAPEGPNRSYAVLGVHGLAPQWFEVDADLFLSERGDLSARLDVDYELLLTNRLILTPSAEIDMAFSSDRAIDVGAGLSKVELGLRLSYDVLDRTLAPYIGVHFERSFGKTRTLVRSAGESTSDLLFVAGVRLRF